MVKLNTMDSLPKVKPVAGLKAAILLLLLAGIYYSTVVWLVTKDWARGDFSYGFLIPFIFLYLIWEKKEEFLKLISQPSWVGFLPFLGGMFLFWIGELSGEFFSLYLSFWLTVVGLIWMQIGWEKVKVIGFPLFILLTMFPIPNFLYQKIAFNLKLLSSQLGVYLMQVCGMTVYREGNVIDLGFTQLQVVDACSGLRYFISLMVVGLLVTYFYRAALWKKITLFISIIPLSIVTNSLRIAITCILYKVWGAWVAEGFFHDFSGVFIFMLCIGVLAVEMLVLNKLFPERKETGTQTPPPGYAGKKEVSSSQIHSTSVSSLFHPPQFLVTIFFLGITLTLSHWLDFRDKIPIKKSFDRFPLQVGDWLGTRDTLEQKFIDTLDLSDYVIVNYKNPQGKAINFYVAYYESQRKGESIHSPETCLRGSGWQFKEAGSVSIPVNGPGARSINVNRALMEQGSLKQMVYFWFSQRGRVLTNAYQLKLYTFWDALTRQRTDGALVRIITPVNEFETLSQAEERLKGFTREIVPVLSDFIPGKTIK